MEVRGEEAVAWRSNARLSHFKLTLANQPSAQPSLPGRMKSCTLRTSPAAYPCKIVNASLVEMKKLYRASHGLLVLLLAALLIRAVYYGFSLLWTEQHPQPPPAEEVVDSSLQKPSPQEIVRCISFGKTVADDPIGSIDEHTVGLVGRGSLQEYMRSLVDRMSPEKLRRRTWCEKAG
jgi:hypothetical protein